MSHAAVGPKFSLGALLSRSWSVFIGNIGAFFVLSALIYAPLLLFLIFFVSTDEVVVGTTAVITSIMTILLNFIVMAVIIHAAFQSLRSQSISIGASFALAWSRILWVILLAILQSILVLLGLVLLIIPGIIIAIMLYVSMACCLVEKLGPFQSMGRSAELTKGFRWHLLGALIIIVVINAVISVVLLMILGEGLIGNLVDWVVSVLVSAFLSVTVAVAYHDLRVEKEGIDIEKIAAMFE